ncbi:(2Fe-2S)-binding protein [Stappia indica]|uniref:Carbon-monoxide dehydrogenase small subunit n=1 Tax=Stappia indica TaxID=538381 RepID=A0A285TJI3_9HYPH|nr:(2Fe-2S)-binding protein [Stappia indica]SOC22531.1 carbon-monoxide dehydrogenase small subunit [Stappia indica]
MSDTAQSFPTRVDISLTVNGEPVDARVDVSRHLVDFLRLDLGLTGAHAGCEHGVCGACTLQVNGDIVRGCLMLAAQLDGAEVWTVEGLTETGGLADLQAAFVERNALQCGFCTPGMLFAAADILGQGGQPSREEIREHISGNYCRCTGYEAVVDAIETVAGARARGEEVSA